MSTLRDRRRVPSDDGRAGLGVLIAIGSTLVFWTALGIGIWWIVA